jgi:hypothetical protein
VCSCIEKREMDSEEREKKSERGLAIRAALAFNPP